MNLQGSQIRRWITVALACLFFALDASAVHAVGSLPLGSSCPNANPRYKEQWAADNFDFSTGICKTFDDCNAGASSPGERIWDPQSPDCSNAGTPTGGCCYYKKAPAAPETPAVNPGSGTYICNPLGTAGILEALSRVLKAFLAVAGAFTLVVFIYAGVLWMTGMSSDRIHTAQNAIKYAIIGLAIITFSYAIVSLIFTALTSAGTSTNGNTNAVPGTPSKPC